MNFKFTKMHGIGNAYAFVNCFKYNLNGINLNRLAKKIADNEKGIDSDGLILILPSKKADFKMRIFNADGSEAEMCGNGIRCFAKYVYDNKLTKKKELAIETLAGIIKTKIIKMDSHKNYTVKVDMGKVKIKEIKLSVDGKRYDVAYVSIGNPHCVLFVENFKFNYKSLGKKIEHHNLFPNRINVEFVKVDNPKEITMRVWERGSGETKACGTGACASVVASILRNKTEKNVTVHLLGGDLDIEWAKNNHVYMTGPAEEMFSGKFKA